MNLIRPIPVKYRAESLNDRIAGNRERALVFAIVLTVVASLYLAFHLIDPETASGGSLHGFYRAMHASMAAFSGIATLWFLRRTKVPSPRQEAIAHGAFIVIVLHWGTGIAVADMVNGEDMTAYALALIATSALLRMPPAFSAASLSVVAALMSIASVLAFGREQVDAAIAAWVYAVVAWFIAAYLEEGRKESFVARRQLEERNEELRDISFHDPLTKLYNRLYVIEAGQNIVLYHRRYGLELHLVLLDIDHFKKVNDTLGHPVGDSVLREFATIIQGCVRTSDTAARYGGEEFLILLPRTNADDALMVAERIRATVEGHDFRGVPWRLTASLGVATLASTDTMESLVARSDELLYRSKNAGRNRVSMA